MSGTEFRWLLGRCYAEQEVRNGVEEGLLALCHRKSIPVFVGAPADGSVFLNSLRLWAMREAFGDEHRFDLERYRLSCVPPRLAKTFHTQVSGQDGATPIGDNREEKHAALEPYPTIP